MFRIAWRLKGDDYYLLAPETFDTFEQASTQDGIERAALATDQHYESVVILDEVSS